MSSTDNETGSATSPATGNGRLQWFSPRRKLFWALFAVLFYTLAGFFGIPPLVKFLTINAIQDKTGRQAEIDRVRFNPYVLSLDVNGFSVDDPDGVKLVGMDQLFVNFQLSSLFRRAWTFQEIRLDGFYACSERFAPGDTRLTRLLADVAAREGPDDLQEQQSGFPRFLIYDLDLGKGRFQFRDNVPENPVELNFGPINVSMQELNSLPDHPGRQSVTIRLPDNASLSWQGSINLGPLRSEGTLVIENSKLDRIIGYLEATLPFDSIHAIFSANSNYRVAEQGDGSIDIELDGVEARLADVAIQGLTPSTEFFSFSALEFSGGTLRYPENELNISSIRLLEPRLEAWRDAGGTFNLLGLKPKDLDDDKESSKAAKWNFGVSEFVIEDGQVEFADHSTDPRATLTLQNLDLTARDINTDGDFEFPVSLEADLASGGKIGFEGRVGMLPGVSLSGGVRASSIRLSAAQPYVQQQAHIRIEEGTLDTIFDLVLNPDRTLTASGELAIAGLKVQDTVQNLPLVGWESLRTDRFETDTAARSLHFSMLSIDQPYGRLIINKDRTTNLKGLRVVHEPVSESAAAEIDDAPGYDVVLGGIQVTNGSMDFSDLSLPLPFATYIRDLGGSISTLDTASSAASTIKLEGQVDDYGLARIQGEMNLLNPVKRTDVAVEFRNLLMSNLSPYTIEFAGYEIAEGKLDLDLLYRIDEGRLRGQNDVVLRDLLLGDKVESPGAANLPLALAVALLKDADGVIDIDLPVEGDVNDPEFKIGGVIWQAFSGLITKIVTAPFRILGSLIGIESEDLGQFQFLAGRFDLTPPELEKVGQLRQALQQRPELSVEVSGAFDPEIDIPALQYLHLRDEVIRRIGADAMAAGREIQMLDEQIRSTLESIFIERFPSIPLDSLKAAHTTTPPDDPKGKPILDGPAYAVDLRDRLLAAEVISSSDLTELAMARADAIRAAFMQSGEFDAGRVIIASPVEVESKDGEWVVMELSVAVE